MYHTNDVWYWKEKTSIISYKKEPVPSFSLPLKKAKYLFLFLIQQINWYVVKVRRKAEI